MLAFVFFFFFQAEDGIRDLVRSRGLGDVYKRQLLQERMKALVRHMAQAELLSRTKEYTNALKEIDGMPVSYTHLTLPTSDLV